MAERRMFAKTIIDSDAFLEMPLTTQALYFHLSMRADDDGFVNNPKRIQRMIGASDDDLRLLIAKSFVLTFESGVIVIKHWRINNYIRNDRYHETVYQEEKALLSMKDNDAYTLGIPNGNQTVYQMETEVRLGKDSIGKNNISRFAPPTLEEVKSYCSERKNNVDAETFINFYESKGWMIGKNKMKDWKAAVRTWEKKDKAKPKSNSFTDGIEKKQNYNFDELERLLQG